MLPQPRGLDWPGRTRDTPDRDVEPSRIFMNRRVRIVTLVVLLLGSGASRASSGEDKPEAAAGHASEFWLAIVDAGKYGESWDAAAQSLKSVVTKDQWVDALNQVRQPLGKVVSRKLKGTEYLENPASAPPGEYVILQFDTAFENNKSSLETVFTMLESKTTWRVSGYQIQQLP